MDERALPVAWPPFQPTHNMYKDIIVILIYCTRMNCVFYTHAHRVIKQYYKLCVKTEVDALKYLFHCHYRYISYLCFTETRKNESNLLVPDDYMFQMLLNLACQLYQIQKTHLHKDHLFVSAAQAKSKNNCHFMASRIWFVFRQ